MIVKVSLSQLRETAARRPTGYYDEIVASGQVKDDALHLERNVYLNLKEKFSTKVNGPSLRDKTLNLVKAGGRVVKAVAKREAVTVSTEEQERRMEICKGCEFFDGTTCQKCGCIARFKTKLATEACPVGKW